ncbi:MAG: Cna B-type domain-containing protein [Anaerotignum sp.]|nr:Cna B-type domain-containing protein [Anaerotignum sp.]
MGSTSFVMADTPDPVYICGETAHTHDASCYGDKLTCTTTQKLAYTCGQVDNGDGTVTYGAKPEHTHGTSCYGGPLTCTLPVGHVHEGKCYSTQENWTCTLAVHDHTSGCNDTPCTVEDEGHDHTSNCNSTPCTIEEHVHAVGNCYTVGPKVVCTIPEGHVHAQATSCYTLTCTQVEHTHGDSCTIAHPVDGHKHGDACYDKNVLLCTKHVHTEACEQPAAVTNLLADLDELNALGLAMQALEKTYDDAEKAVADIQAEINKAIAADPAADVTELQEQLTAKQAELAAAEKALEDLPEMTTDFAARQAAAIDVYNQWSAEHPEYQTLMAERYAKYEKLMIEGVVFGGDADGSGSTGNGEGNNAFTGVGTTNDSSNIVMNLFNYDDSIVNHYNSGAFILDFYDWGGNNAVDTEGHSSRKFAYPAYGYSVNSELGADGYPEIFLDADPSNGVSLKGLFDGTHAGVYDGKKGAYYGVTGLLAQDGTHYYYDSAVNAAKFDTTTETFSTYNFTVMPKGVTDRNGNFLPFNDPTVNKGVDHKATSETYGRYELNQDNDMWFGMTMEFDFLMPAEGKLGDDDMIFKFSGDDDVLVYIDNKLVIDLKGCHEVETATINFNTGAVVEKYEKSSGTNVKNLYYDKLVDLQGNPVDKFGKIVKADSKDRNTTPIFAGGKFPNYEPPHTLKFFYLERGGMYSNCSLDFNMPTIPKHSLTVKKEVTNAGDVLGADAQEYKFRVLEVENSNVTNDSFITKPVNVTIQKTDEDGTKHVVRRVVLQPGKDTFILKHGEEAVIPAMNEQGSVTSYYAVQEILPKDFTDGFNVYTPKSDGGTVETEKVTAAVEIDTEFAGVTTDPILNQKARIVKFKNHVVGEKLGVLEITKEARDNLNQKYSSFPIQVLFGDMYGTNEPSVPLAVGTNYTVTKEVDGKEVTETKKVEVAGIINLANGETARIERILPGTKYLISEPEAEKGGYTPVFAEGYGATGAVPVKTTENGTEKIAKVSIVNRETEFGVEIPLNKTVNGMPKYVAFEDDFEFVAELVGYATNEQNGFGAFFDKLQFLAKYKNNVAAANKTTSIKEVSNGITATNSVGAASATKAGKLQLKFDVNTPNGVYTYKVKEVLSDAQKDVYEAKGEYTVKVKVDQSKDGAARAVIVDDNGNPVEKVRTLEFVNNRSANRLDVTVTKAWGTTNNSKIHPTDSVTVKLMVDGEAKETVDLTAPNWTHTWKGVVLDTETWTVVEDPVPDKYIVSYEYAYTATTAAATVTNTPKGTTGGSGDDYGSLQISKITRGDTTFTTSDVFNMEVKLDGAYIPTNVKYTVTKADGTKVEGNPLADGIIPMHAGDVVLINGILKDTEYKVTEKAGDGYYATYTDAEGTIEASTVHGVVVKNHSTEFGVTLDLLKQVFDLNPSEYTFNFDIELFSYRDEAGNPVNNIVDPNKAEKSITVEVPAAEATSAAAVKTVPEGTGEFALKFDADTPDGTYVYVVTEKADYDLKKFKENKQKFAVTVVVDQDAEQRAVITSVKNEDGDELGTTARLTFVNMTRDAAPKQVVSVVKEWKNDDTLRPAVTVKLTVTLNGDVVAEETVELNASNNWRKTWYDIDTDATCYVEEVGVKGYSTTDGKTWTADDGTKAYYTTTTSDPEDVTYEGVVMKQVTITNTRVVPSSGGGGGNGGGGGGTTPPVNIDDEDVPLTGTPDDEEGMVLGAEDVVLKEDEEGMVLGAEDEEEGMVAGIADTGDSKAMIFAGAGMLAAVAGIVALRKKKED